MVENFNHKYPETFILIITLFFTKVLHKCAGTEHTLLLKYTYMTISLRYCITLPFVRIFNLGVILFTTYVMIQSLKIPFTAFLLYFVLFRISTLYPLCIAFLPFWQKSYQLQNIPNTFSEVYHSSISRKSQKFKIHSLF